MQQTIQGKTTVNFTNDLGHGGKTISGKAAIAFAQGTSASGQDGNRLEAKPAGPVRKDAPIPSRSHTEGAA